MEIEPAEPSTESRCIIVLGMHRSGTSTLSGTLQDAGLYLGSVLKDKFALNPKGLQEAPSILRMHENLLEANGGSWDKPPDPIVWSKLHTAVWDLFIESREGRKVWGFKDPRTLLVLDGWFEVLPEADCAGIFRHPAEVALSLRARNGFDLEKCFDIWMRYNTELLKHQRQRAFPLLEFVSDQDRMAATLSHATRQLGLHATAPQVFYDGKLKNHDSPDIAVPAAAEHMYKALQEQAL